MRDTPDARGHLLRAVKSNQRGFVAVPSLESVSYRRRIRGVRALRIALLVPGLPLAFWYWLHPGWIFGVLVVSVIATAGL